MSRQKWAGYRARWRGDEYRAAIFPLGNVLWVRLHSAKVRSGFQEVTEQDYVQSVLAEECDAVLFVSTVCTWRGAEFLVTDERGEELQLEYVEGDAIKAMGMGLERIERGVYRGWVQRDEVRGLRESTAIIFAGG